MTTYQGLKYSDTTAATLAGIKQSIYFEAKCNALAISDGDMNRIINKYYSRLQEVIKSVNENFYMSIATSDLVIGDGSYTFPDGTGTAPAYEKLKSIWVAFKPADKTAPLVSEYRRVNIIDPDSISDPAYIFSEGSPNAQMFGTYFVLNPLVTDVTKYPVTDGVKVYYIATQDKLTNDTDIPKIFPTFHDAIVIGSKIDVYEKLGDTTARDKAKKEFSDRLEEVRSYASNRIPDELGLVEGQDDMGGWSFPWGNYSMS